MTPDGRFAPSPTGDLHLGNLRTALVAWLFARSQGAAFRMRMEDLDTGRVRPGVAERQLADLAAIGVDWDGEVMCQSERHAGYAAALGRLEAMGRLYPCFCTRAEIRASVSAPHGPGREGAYPGTCLGLSEDERASRLATGRRPALRVRAERTHVAFDDRLRGRHEAEVDDFVVRRNDGAFAYNLAVVVDDAAQGVGEVVRGDDLLASTPRQRFLTGLLELPQPAHAHVPLVLGPDGTRLAKRHGAVTLRDVAPDTALAWMARSLGLPAVVMASELLAAFDPRRLPQGPATYEPDRPPKVRFDAD